MHRDLTILQVKLKMCIYLQDYTSYDASTPRLDAQQDWNLLNATEADGITYVKFSRRLSTGDPVDIEIRVLLFNIQNN